MTKEGRKIEAKAVLARLIELELKPELNGKWIVYAQKVPNNLLMRALAVSNEMFELLKGEHNGHTQSE